MNSFLIVTFRTLNCRGLWMDGEETFQMAPLSYQVDEKRQAWDPSVLGLNISSALGKLVYIGHVTERLWAMSVR